MLGWTAVTAHAWLFCTCRVIIALSGQPAVSAAVEGRSLHLLEYEGSATRALGVLRLGWTMTLPLTALGSVILIAVSLISAGGVPWPGLVACCSVLHRCVAALGLGGWMRARRDAYCAGAAGAGAAWASVFIVHVRGRSGLERDRFVVGYRSEPHVGACNLYSTRCDVAACVYVDSILCSPVQLAPRTVCLPIAARALRLVLTTAPRFACVRCDERDDRCTRAACIAQPIFTCRRHQYISIIFFSVLS